MTVRGTAYVWRQTKGVAGGAICSHTEGVRTKLEAVGQGLPDERGYHK